MKRLCDGCFVKQYIHCMIYYDIKSRRKKKECPCQQCLLKLVCTHACTKRISYVSGLTKLWMRRIRMVF
jgi:hypothetical protein